MRKNHQVTAGGGIGGISSLGTIGRGRVRAREKIWDKGNGSFKRIKDQRPSSPVRSPQLCRASLSLVCFLRAEADRRLEGLQLDGSSLSIP